MQWTLTLQKWAFLGCNGTPPVCITSAVQCLASCETPGLHRLGQPSGARRVVGYLVLRFWRCRFVEDPNLLKYHRQQIMAVRRNILCIAFEIAVAKVGLPETIKTAVAKWPPKGFD